MEREKFSSRLGFILISAGCAIGLGNVYRFPIITGAYGGALFVLIYLAFLLMLGIPVMCAELSVGRASQRSIATNRAKEGLAGLFNLQANKKLLTLLGECDARYPSVKAILQELCSFAD